MVELGSYPPVSEDDIVAFARRWDPQPFHTDPERARSSMFGTLVASGWHTGCIAMRLLVDGLLSRCAAQGSPGVDHIRFPHPVRPGDRLTGRYTVLEVSGSERRRHVGKVLGRTELFNQRGETVLSLEATGFFERRPPGP